MTAGHAAQLFRCSVVDGIYDVKGMIPTSNNGLLRVVDPWRRLVYLSIPVLLVNIVVFLPPQVIFEVGWRLTHPRHVHADLYMARYKVAIANSGIRASLAR